MRRQLLALILLLFSPPVLAEALTGELALFYMNGNSVRNRTDNDGNKYTLKAKTTYTFTALGFCYRLDWVCIGLKYLQGSIEQKASDTRSSGSSLQTTTFSGPGITLGASVNEWVAHVTWMLSASKRVTDKTTSYGNSTTTGDKYPAKTATLIDLGYGFKVASVRIGPLLSILHMDYKKCVCDGVSQSLPGKDSDDFLMPHFALWMDF